MGICKAKSRYWLSGFWPKIERIFVEAYSYLNSSISSSGSQQLVTKWQYRQDEIMGNRLQMLVERIKEMGKELSQEIQKKEEEYFYKIFSKKVAFEEWIEHEQ